MARGGVEVEQQKLRTQTIKQGGVSACLVDQIRMERDADTGKRAFRSADADADGCALPLAFLHRGLCARAPRYLEFN